MKQGSIIIQPKITEKSIASVAAGVYTFIVNVSANKFNIKDEIEKLFNVKVSTVKTALRRGKVRRVGRKMRIKKLPVQKIAYITLKQGKIDIFPQS